VPPATAGPVLRHPRAAEAAARAARGRLTIDMRRLFRTRWVRIAALLLLVGGGALWLTRPEPPPPPRGSGEYMQAVVYREYGTADVLQLARVEQWLPEDHQVLVQIHAAAANPLDWHYMRGTPYVMRIESGFAAPTDQRLGADLAGVVVAVGRDVKQFKPGDAVFGTGGGTFAEYARASAQKVVHKPADLTFEQAAAVPVAALTALQALRDKGRIEAGQKVLINGASGGVGTFAVQIAKTFGADVTGVCSTRNVELVRSLGADHVIDYTRDDFTQGSQRYDLIVDNVGNHPLLAYRRVMNPDATYVLVGGGGPDDGRWIGPMAKPIRMLFLSPFVSQKYLMLLASINAADLEFVRSLIESGRVRPVIDRTYPLREVPEAIRYLEKGRARGKVIITVDPAG
jgi:NADPH:quinone reductase-like Zn-dependent oxidoreductase